MDKTAVPNERDEQRLITDALVELITSKRKLGLYPKDHPKIRESLQRAFADLQRLLEIRGTTVVGIAGDTLIVDESCLDSRNPGLKDFARSFHDRGIAAVAFAPGLTIEELQNYHELMISRDLPVGRALADLAENRGLRYISLTPLDISKFSFVEGGVRKELSSGSIWEDYVRGLLDGGLGDGDGEQKITDLQPGEIAGFLNQPADEAARGIMIEGVLRHYFHTGRGLQELFAKLLGLVEDLAPDVRELFLKKAMASPLLTHRQVTRMMKELSADSVERMMRLFQEHAALLSESLRQLIGMRGEEMGPAFFSLQGREGAFIDDIEAGSDVAGLFSGGEKDSFVDDRYQALLNRVQAGQKWEGGRILPEINGACLEGTVDTLATGIMFDLLSSQSGTREEYLGILNRLSDFLDHYIDTGRFEEIAAFYERIYEDSQSGAYREDAALMLRRVFGSREFTDRLTGAFKIWGRHDRERVCCLTLVLKEYLLGPLIDSLSIEQDAMVRHFLLEVLVRIGEDVQAAAVKKLGDNRWYVVRNMIYLIRECGGLQYVQNIRHLAKHPDRRVAVEAIKTLVHFNASDSFSYIRYYLQSRDLHMRDQIVRIAGTCRVTAAVPYLSELLLRKDFSEGGEHTAALVKALAEIGDPSAIDVFTRLYKSSSLLHRSDLEALRVEIFRHLHFFPADTARPLIELGVQSRNEEIRMIAQRLLLRKRTNGR